MFSSYFYLFLPILIVIVRGEIPFFLLSRKHDLNRLGIFNLDLSERSCENFYETSCSQWKSETKKPEFETHWNHFIAASYDIKKKVQTVLNASSDTTDILLKKVGDFYFTCVNFEDEQEKYFVDLKLIIEYFKGWPLIEERWSVDNYNWLEEISEITRTLGFNPILKIHVSIDYKNTHNYTLYIEPSNLIFPQNILLNPEQYSLELIAYTKWITRTIMHLYPKTKVTRRMKMEISRIVDFEMQLARLMPIRLKMERNTIQNFSQRFNLNFIATLENLFVESDMKIYPNDTIVIRNYVFFKKLTFLLKKVNRRTIVKEFSRDTTAYLKNMNFFIDQSVLGITSDVSRDIECTNKAIEHFSYAILSQYLKMHIKVEVLDQVQQIVSNVKQEYVDLLLNNEWLSNETKSLAVEKIENIGSVIGFSDWMRNKTLLEQYYRKLNISDNHLSNIIRANSFKIAKNLELFRTSVALEQWPSNIFDVNAYYSVLQNSVFIPLGIIQEPFYMANRPSILNYGALGSLIGHELSHSLDTTGRQANLHGIITKWWPSKDIEEYHLKTKCFEHPSKDQDIKTRNNILLVGENIADNVGLDISYKAYRKLNNMSLSEYFWEHENDHIFFLSYAQMWCEISDQLEHFKDEHSSVEIRVNQAVSNNIDFNVIYKCNKNISNICQLW